ncbi:dienelactone hydrolase family protein [Dinoroseobacter sp. PD6]|uniref:alpha/beta hydrolase n=1 Tax=Dinoroseobacter sp. PD6 TaxID=3028384 RepID=UPI00237A4E40|nr:dienelactone hydrolase family protein [Dinoroseobacter sp. PD6]MDD9718362.1 dienelactone hydrolase family protein [Dinoroseobacter sp. PD6]
MTARLVRGGAPASRAQAGLVLVHGRGGSAADILQVGEALGLPDLALIGPEHPARSWWPTSFLALHAEMAAPLEAGLDAVADAVAALEAEGLPRARIAVAGFSQGACLALEYAARQGTGLAGAFGFSGALVGTGDTDGAPTPALYGHGDKRFDYETDLRGLPVYLSVHEQDPHIPHARAQRSAEVFRGLGATVDTVTAPGAGHGLLSEDITALRGLLNRPAA